MRASEFIRENASAGASCSGGVATVAQPLGTVISRAPLSRPAKYANSLKSYNGKKQHVIR